MLSLHANGENQWCAGASRRRKVAVHFSLTNPTTAGVMASFASLGDVIIAEPKSMNPVSPDTRD